MLKTIIRKLKKKKTLKLERLQRFVFFLFFILFIYFFSFKLKRLTQNLKTKLKRFWLDLIVKLNK